jgi:HPt (histidine-containing phosphotransfer) domain-containing protein
MDVQMPVMDGLAASEHIRNQMGLPELPIIAMTAHALSGDRETCLAAGMNDYVTKPIDPEVLFAALSRHLTGVEYHPGGRTVAEAGPSHPELPGIDVRTGLFRANNNLRLYLKLLRSFAADYGSALDRMATDLEAGRTEAVRRDAHSLKGIGGNIGAQTLHEKAAALEQAMNAGGLNLESSLWSEFAEALEQVLDGLAGADLTDPSETPARDETGSDPFQWPAQLRRLVELLDEDLEQARSLIESLRPGLTGSDAGDLFLELAEQVENFELDEAAETLERLIASEPWHKE